jgi:NADH dehydrogenase FAD-containing subunit
MTASFSSPKLPVKVVILGGGFCGTRIAKKLEKEGGISTVLIDRKPYFEYSPLVYKIPTNISYLRIVRLPFEQILQKTETIIDEIKEVTPHTVKTDKHEIHFDILVIATGIDYPIRLQNTTSVYSVKSSVDTIRIASGLKAAKNILVIGGGFIGVEIAAELASRTKNKQITLVHANTRLLERLPLKASKYAKKYLRNHDVKIILNEKIVQHQKKQFTTDKGRVITADLGIWSAGNKWNPSFLQEFSPKVYSPRGALKTNQFLQLKGYPNIFVGGDITAIPEEKTAQNTERHADLISKNTKRLIKKQKLAPYSIQLRPIVVNLGKWKGILTYSELVFNGLLPGIAKQLVDWWTVNQYK